MVDLEAARTILLVHGGELADVRALLDELGLGFREAVPSAAADAYPRADVVLASPPFLLDRLASGEEPRPGEGPTRIAVLEGEARALRTMLARGGIEWVVRRPFHPAALRLLLLHCIYQGPEKRRARRVCVGAAVQLQVGWRRRGGLLADLSERDCRVLCERPVAVGRAVRLRLPADLMGRRPLVVAGRVARAGDGPAPDGSHTVCVVFDPVDASAARRLEELLARHRRGPALYPRARRGSRSGTGPGTKGMKGIETAGADAPPRRSVIAFGKSEPVAASAGHGTSGLSGEERRREPRHAFRRRVIALGEEAARVLVGRDISLRGMRVESGARFELGQRLRLAVHVPGQPAPLVVTVRVERDDGPRGLVLGFRDLTPAARDYLEKMIAGLGDVSAASVRAGAAVVSEIVGIDGD